MEKARAEISCEGRWKVSSGLREGGEAARTEVWPSLAAKVPVLVQLSVEMMTISVQGEECQQK